MERNKDAKTRNLLNIANKKMSQPVNTSSPDIVEERFDTYTS